MPHTNTPMLSLAAMEAKRLWPFVFGFAVYGGLIYKANAALTRTALFSTTLLHTHTDIYIYIYAPFLMWGFVFNVPYARSCACAM